MEFTIDFYDNSLPEEQILELTKKINSVREELIQKMENINSFLTNEKMKENYFEVHLPFFDIDLTFMFSKINEKYLISVLDHNNSTIFANLVIPNYNCLLVKDLKKLGEWETYSNGKLGIFKFL